MPVTALRILESTPVAGAADEAGRLERKRAIWSVSEWPKRAAGGVNPVCIPFELGPRRGILEVIGTIALRHPRSLDERRTMPDAISASVAFGSFNSQPCFRGSPVINDCGLPIWAKELASNSTPLIASVAELP